ncbi:MAG: hypothetical protein AAFQ43_08375, partial [Bacteroidota bacterium]
ELDEASEWLKGQGFHAPFVLQQTVPDRGLTYLAFVDPSQLAPSVLALYTPNTAGIFLNTTSFIGVGRGRTEEDAARRLAYDRVHQQSPVHEVFHGIQFQYARDLSVAWGRGDYAGPERDWIWEGTARAIEALWARRSSGEGDVRVPLFYLDNPIYRPDTDRLDQYNLARFWLFAGTYLESEGGRLAYLHDVFKTNLSPASGVQGVDGHFRAMNARIRSDRDGLADVLTAYAADKGNAESHYEEVGSVSISAGTAPVTTKKRSGASDLAVDATSLSLQVSDRARGGVGLSIRIEDADRPDDLHLIVDDQRYDLEDPLAPEAERNVYRDAYPPGDHEVLIRVVNAASNASQSRTQAFTLVIDAVPLEPCSDEAMESAVTGLVRYSGLQRASAFDEDELMRPGVGEMQVSGLVSGRGHACGFNLAEVSLIGQAIAGDVSAEDVEATGMARAAEMEQMMANLPPRLRRAMQTGEDPGTLTAAEMRAMQEMASGAMGLMSATDDSEARAVLHVFSPHLMMWQTGMLGVPFQTAHRGVGGWPTNAAAQVVLEFDEATPRSLRTGETYTVRAIAPSPEAEGLPQSVPSMGGFFSSWEGEFQPIPPQNDADRRRLAEERAECEANQKATIARIDAMVAEGGGLINRNADLDDCAVLGTAFQGETRVASGTLSGTVTITRITGATVEGTFDVSGSGVLHRTVSRFTYAEETGLLDGDETEEIDEPGPISISGRFFVPASIEGIERPFGYRSVSLSRR